MQPIHWILLGLGVFLAVVWGLDWRDRRRHGKGRD
jgi:hypothetical protein